MSSSGLSKINIKTMHTYPIYAMNRVVKVFKHLYIINWDIYI